jgi:hypothetical protein
MDVAGGGDRLDAGDQRLVVEDMAQLVAAALRLAVDEQLSVDAAGGLRTENLSPWPRRCRPTRRIAMPGAGRGRRRGGRGSLDSRLAEVASIIISSKCRRITAPGGIARRACDDELPMNMTILSEAPRRAAPAATA